MQTASTATGHVSVSLIAGDLAVTGSGGETIGTQVSMRGMSGFLYLKPEIAKQWLPVIQKIAEEEK